MPVAIYKLRIREQAGDDNAWQEARVVAASLAEALVQAQQRFGDERVMAIEQDHTGEPVDASRVERADDDLTDDDRADVAAALSETTVDETLAHAVAADPLADDPALIVARPPDIGTHVEGADVEVDWAAIVDAQADARPPRADAWVTVPAREPLPWEGRWRPSVLVWSGIAAGVLLFVGWYYLGAPSRDRFVTAAPQAAAPISGLPIDGTTPRGGALAATGVSLHAGDEDSMGEMVGEAVAGWPEVEEAIEGVPGEDDEAATVRTIGTIVGDIFARWPDDAQAHDADAPPYRVAQPAEPIELEPAAVPGATVAYPPPAIAAREPSVLRPFYVEVERSGNITETLRVTAYDADHARAIVAGLPDRPIIVEGPSPQLDW